MGQSKVGGSNKNMQCLLKYFYINMCYKVVYECENH